MVLVNLWCVITVISATESIFSEDQIRFMETAA